jgi:hypothetical protein
VWIARVWRDGMIDPPAAASHAVKPVALRSDTSRVSPRLLPTKIVVRFLIGGVCAAAVAAILALLQGSFDDAHWRVVAASLSFSVASATAGAGDALRARADDATRVVIGVGTIVASAVAFLLFVVGIWFDGGEIVWRACGVCALFALCGSHASLVLRGRRRSDTQLIDVLVITSVATAVFDTLVGSVAASGAVDDVSSGFVRFVAVVLVVMLLATAVVPLLRRAGAQTLRGPADVFGRAIVQGPLTVDGLTDELSAMAERLAAYDAPPAVAREAQTLRNLVARAPARDRPGLPL